MNFQKDFEKFAVSRGVSSNTLNGYSNYTNALVSPTILEERTLNVVGYDVFSRLLYDRIIFLGSEINSDVANIITSQLLYLRTTGNDDINLFINSPGGSVTDGLAIYDMMQYIEPDVKTTCMGLCASMGAVLLSSGQKGKRSSNAHGDIMIHQPLGGTHGQASDILIEAEQIKKCKDTLYQILSENTGKSVEEITRDADRNFWMNPQEALDYGLIDKINMKK